MDHFVGHQHDLPSSRAFLIWNHPGHVGRGFRIVMLSRKW
jgi:hypothetical protein